MSKNNASTASNVESKCTPVDDIESNQAMSDKATPGKVENTDIQSKQVMFPKYIFSNWPILEYGFLWSLMQRYMLEIDVADDTRHVVVVLFDEPTTALVKCSTESTTEPDDEVTLQDLCNAQKPFSIYFLGQISDDATSLLPKIDPTEGVEESMGSSTLDVDAGSHTPKLKRMDQDLYVHTPLKPSEEGIKIRGEIKEIEDSDVEEIYGSAKGSSKDKVGIYSDKNKRKRYSFSLEVEDSAVEESHGSAQGSSKDNVGIHSDKKK
ncbi:hypothetical protein Tco_1057004 [Tanacetum coccineum]|uniref:Uncharacterized protein n=1 Tax=Tanacetum coccineum TaxID=301880 RepID=A0ABQ5H5X5_9ASTR